MISKRWLLLTSIFAFCVVLLTTLHVAAQDRAVNLSDFIVEPTQDDLIELFFETGSEEDTAEFFFLRGRSENDPVFTSPSPSLAITVTYNGTPTRFIAAQGGGAGDGATYDDIIDEDVVDDGEEYCYMIGERELDNSVAYFLNDILCATVGDLAFSQLSATMSDLTAVQGMSVTHIISITNEGNRDQEFLVTAVMDTLEWPTTIPEPITAITSGGTVTRSVIVEVPNQAQSGAFDAVDIRISLINKTDRPPDLPDYSITTTVTTRVPGVGEFPLYLPLLVK